jgi:rhodanese-related sulfurtransferase
MLRFLLAILPFTAAAESSRSARQIAQDVKAGKAVLLDVREADEIKSGIVQAAIWLPTSSILKKDARYQTLLGRLDKTKTVYTYCASGKRSGDFAESLERDGYTAVNAGGFESLKKDGLTQSPAADATDGAPCPYLCEPRG